MRNVEMRLVLTALSLTLAGCGPSASDGEAGGQNASTAGGETGGSVANAAPAGGMTSADGNAHAMPDSPFVDVTADSGIAFQVGFTRPYLIRNQRAVTESTFGGIAAGDCDGDDDIDLFITYGAQNMSLNSFVTRDGLEMGRAQVVQAQACRLDPDVRMNPILLKPSGNSGCQIIVNGRPVADMSVNV